MDKKLSGGGDELVSVPLSGAADDAAGATTRLLGRPSNSGGGPINGSSGGGGGGPRASSSGGYKAPRGVLRVERGGGFGRIHDDDDILMDWESAHTRRWHLFGLDCTWAMRCVPERFHTPPEWWFRLSKGRRKAIVYGTFFGVLALLAGILVVLPAAAGSTAAVASGAAKAGAPRRAGGHTPLYADADTNPICKWSSVYLPEEILPEHYDLEIRADPRKEPFTVDGSVAILLKPLEVITPCIVVNAKGVNVVSARLVLGDEDNGGEVIAGGLYNTTGDEQVILKFEEAIPVNSNAVTLKMTFSYDLKEGLEGFYRSYYKDGSTTHVVASTNFETLGARKAFPCFDEPPFKATFTIRIVGPPKPWTVLSNMPVGRMLAETGDLLTYQFDRTPRMSTYVVAWAIGEFDSIAEKCDAGSGGVTVSVWAPPTKINELRTSMDAACSALHTYEQLLGVRYALPKLDLLAVPNFEAGAMENWGLIMYRESRLLVDSATDDVRQEFTVSTAVAHQVAHMWFGNLVTLEDWDELWLNEGFATYFEYIGADAFRPTYKYFDYFVTREASRALQEDGRLNSHPLSVPKPMKSLDEVDDQFDDVSYAKGAAVLRMLRAYLNVAGPNRGTALTDSQGVQRMRRLAEISDPFMNGLRTYLNQRGFNTAIYSDLWTAMGTATGMPIGEMMNTWTLRRGYPILAVDPPPTKKAGGAPPDPLPAGSLRLAQYPYHTARSFEVGTPYGPEEYCNDWSDDATDSSWWIPVAFKTSNAPTTLNWHAFNTCDSALPIGDLAPGGWLVVNAGRTGFYRVNYSEPLWRVFIEAAKVKDRISEVDLAGALDDAFSLALARQLQMTTFMRLTQALGQRRAAEYGPWSIALKSLRHLNHLLSTAGYSSDKWARCAATLRKYVTNVVTKPFLTTARIPVTDRLGMTLTVDAAEPIAVRMLRPEMMLAAGVLGYEPVVTQALDLAGGDAPIHPDVAGVVYKLAVFNPRQGTFDLVLQKYKKEKSSVRRVQMLMGLAFANEDANIRRALQLVLSKDIRSQDIGQFIEAIGDRGGLAFHMVWEFLAQSLPQIISDRFQGDKALFSFGRNLKSLTNLFTDDATLEAARLIAASNPGVFPPRFLDDAREAMQRNQQWLRVQGEATCAWLEKHASAAG